MATDKEKVMSKRDQLMSRLQEAYPDRDFSNDDDFYGQISDDFDERDRRLKDYEESERQLGNIFSHDAESAAFFVDLAKGKSPIASLVERYGPVIRAAVDDPTKVKELEAATKVYLDRVAKNNELNEAFEKNIGESFDAIEKAGISDEDFGKAMDKLQAMMNDFVVGKISPETIELVLGGLNHDTDVADAENLGEVRGKNIRHEERLRKPAGDGLPSMSSANNRQRSRKTEPDLGALGRYADYRDSFAGAKRTRMS